MNREQLDALLNPLGWFHCYNNQYEWLYVSKGLDHASWGRPEVVVLLEGFGVTIIQYGQPAPGIIRFRTS